MPGDDTIRFVLDGEIVELNDVDPTRTVLQFLREDISRKGTKEGCAEGDCGACTVVVADADGSKRAINSCIQFLPTLDGKQLFTVESLSSDEQLHPAQAAMVSKHGSQCGFCTPGFVMSLFALYESNPSPTRTDIDDALAGNLCRCTGYRPIVSAALEMQSLEGESPGVRSDLLATLQRDDMLAIEHKGRRFFAPQTVDEFASVFSQHPDATILAGGTDVGLWVTKQHRELNTVIYTGCVEELGQIDDGAGYIDIGAAVSLSDVMPAIVEHYPGLEELMRRFASPPIRNAGTLGGNVANGSPIGDSMAALMVVGATLVLRRASAEREVAIDGFYHDYMVNDLQEGEFLVSIRVPLPQGDEVVRSHKWSKRFDQDISAVCTAYRLELDSDNVVSFRMACGGLAATVKRATRVEQAVNGKVWNEATVEAACAVLAADFSPISDMRASADIRLLACQNMLRRFFRGDAGRQSADGVHLWTLALVAASNVRPPSVHRWHTTARACTSPDRRPIPTICPSRVICCMLPLE